MTSQVTAESWILKLRLTRHCALQSGWTEGQFHVCFGRWVPTVCVNTLHPC